MQQVADAGENTIDAGAHQSGDPQHNDKCPAPPDPGLQRQPRETGAKGIGVLRTGTGTGFV